MKRAYIKPEIILSYASLQLVTAVLPASFPAKMKP